MEKNKYSLNKDKIEQKLKNTNELIKQIIKEILINVNDGRKEPFKCLPISILIAGFLIAHEIDVKVIYGSLLYNGNFLFKYKEDSLNLDCLCHDELPDNLDFYGHAWVEIDNKIIIDASIFRTLYYSQEIKNDFKEYIYKEYGKNKGALIFKKNYTDNFQYIKYNYVKEEIIKITTDQFSQYMLAKNKNKK